MVLILVEISGLNFAFGRGFKRGFYKQTEAGMEAWVGQGCGRGSESAARERPHGNIVGHIHH